MEYVTTEPSTSTNGSGQTVAATCKCGKTTITVGNVETLELRHAICCGEQDKQ